MFNNSFCSYYVPLPYIFYLNMYDNKVNFQAYYMFFNFFVSSYLKFVFDSVNIPGILPKKLHRSINRII